MKKNKNFFIFLYKTLDIYIIIWYIVCRLEEKDMENIQLFNENKVELKKQITDFLNYIDVSKNSVYTYKVGLKNFVEYLKERTFQ